jgi:hypothetical protein
MDEHFALDLLQGGDLRGARVDRKKQRTQKERGKRDDFRDSVQRNVHLMHLGL